jgi:hypothetical protein
MRADVPCIGQIMRLGERLQECLATLGTRKTTIDMKRHLFLANGHKRSFINNS